MKRFFWLALMAIPACLQLLADEWQAPEVRTVFSADGSRFVRVVPGSNFGDTVGFSGAQKGSPAQALFYSLQPDRSYDLIAEISLLNPISPVDLLVSNSGYLITFDNWHNAGYGAVVAIYSPSGKPVASWKLEDLYSHEQIHSISTSVSSRWWRCSPFHFVSRREQRKVVARESLGGYFVFDLAKGEFAYYQGAVECSPL